MLNTLSSYSSREIEGILSSTVLSMLPDPGIYPSDEGHSSDLDIRTRVIDEICQKHKIEDWDSQEGRSQVMKVISSLIMDTSIPKDKIDSIKASIGHRGILRADRYKIEYMDVFDEMFKPLGTRKSHIESALRNPDSFEHLSLGSDQESASSIYCKIVGSKPNDFTLIVSAKREGYTQKVGYAWRAYHAEFPYFNLRSPIAILSEFVNRYGLEMTMGGRKSKLFINVVIPMNKGQDKTVVVSGPFEGSSMCLSGFF